MHCLIFHALAAKAIVFFLVLIASAQHTTSTTTITRTVAYRTSITTIYSESATRANTISSVQSAAPAPLASNAMHQHGAYSLPAMKSAILNSTNFFRSQHLASPLSWDSTLAAFAHRHARTCIFAHSGGPYGENIASGFATPALVVDAWAAEEKLYTYPNGGFSEATGHYTQLVWKNTTHVGCGVSNCNNNQVAGGIQGWFTVCEYSPAGNVEGGYQWNVQKPGESEDGKLGFGAASAGLKLEGYTRLLVALVAASSLAVAWL